MALKNQLRNSEVHFRQQIDKVKEDVILSRQQQNTRRSGLVTGSEEQISINHRPRREVALKIAIQQLHLVIADYIERIGQQGESIDTEHSTIIFEMEKALSVAQTTIQKLEAELDREKFRSSQLENEWDALS